MKMISRLFLFGVFTLVSLTAACSGQQGSATPAGTTVPGNLTSSPTSLATETAATAATETTSTEATSETTTETATTATVDLTGTAPSATDTTQTAGTSTTLTPGIPVTGSDVILLECQFCIQNMAQALLVIPDTATFEVVNNTASLSTPGPDTGCNTVDTFEGRQVVICRGQENTSLTVSICLNGSCTQLEVELQPCPLAGTSTPTYP